MEEGGRGRTADGSACDDTRKTVHLSEDGIEDVSSNANPIKTPREASNS